MSKRKDARKPKALVEFVKLSMKLARMHLSPYGSYKSRHDFTQPQLMTCLVLRAYWKTTYRGVIEQLEVSGELRRAMGLKSLPNYSTLNKFAHRVGVVEVLDAVLATLAEAAQASDDSVCKEAAMDATGLETSSASAHYVSRSGRKRRGFVKVSVLVLGGSLIPASAVLGYGPGNDKTQARELMDKASRSVRPDILYADPGYDAEWVHRYCHEDWGVMPVIKPVKHKDGPPGGAYRSLMTESRLKKLGYGRRWLVECYNSALKRTTGSTLNAKTHRGRMIDAATKVLAYAIRR
jgi:hypothetical protein